MFSTCFVAPDWRMIKTVPASLAGLTGRLTPTALSVRGPASACYPILGTVSLPTPAFCAVGSNLFGADDMTTEQFLHSLSETNPTGNGYTLALCIDARLLGIDDPNRAVRRYWPTLFTSQSDARAEGMNQFNHSPLGHGLVTFEVMGGSDHE